MLTPQMQTVLWIASVGGLLLFAAIAGLVALMYLLTSPMLFGRRTRASSTSDDAAIDEGKAMDRPRAAALAVAVACAEADRVPAFSADETSDWRLLHRSLRLTQGVARRRVAAE